MKWLSGNNYVVIIYNSIITTYRSWNLIVMLEINRTVLTCPNIFLLLQSNGFTWLISVLMIRMLFTEDFKSPVYWPCPRKLISSTISIPFYSSPSSVILQGFNKLIGCNLDQTLKLPWHFKNIAGRWWKKLESSFSLGMSYWNNEQQKICLNSTHIIRSFQNFQRWPFRGWIKMI